MRKWLKSLLGEVFFVPVEENMKVALIFAQEGYGTDNLYTDYAVLCATLFAVFKKNINRTVRIPYQTKAGKAHDFNRGMKGRTLELLWEKFQNNFVYIHVFVTTWHLKYDIIDT